MPRSFLLLVSVLLVPVSLAHAQRSPSYVLEDALKEDPARCPADLGAYRDGPLEYPPGAMRFKEEGQVVLGLCVAPDGYTETIEILKSSPHNRLNLMTALWACGKRREPARSADGTPVRSCAAVVDITWRLSEFDIPKHILNPRVDEAPLAVRPVGAR